MPITDELRQHLSTPYLVMHALDELRQHFGMRIGQIVPISAGELAERAGISESRARQIADDMEGEEQPFMRHEPHRGFVQLQPLPKLTAVRQ